MSSATRRVFTEGPALGLLAAALTLCSAPSPAEAQTSPVVVVVESADAHVDAGRIRARLGTALGAEAVPLFHASAAEARGVLSVAVDRTGRHASVQYRPNGRIDRAVLINIEADASADAAGEWIVAPALSLIRTSESWLAAPAFGAELLDPWIHYRVEPQRRAASDMRLPPEVIDPFVGSPPRRVRVTISELYLGDEVLDPWAEVEERISVESGGRLSRPRPRGERRDR